MRGYVCMLGDESGRHLYVGVTIDVVRRVWQHRAHVDPTSFSARHSTHRLLLIERYPSIVRAMAREKQLKGWRRAKKLHLISRTNPNFTDLAEHWPDHSSMHSPPPAGPSA